MKLKRRDNEKKLAEQAFESMKNEDTNVIDLLKTKEFSTDLGTDINYLTHDS
jgi:hypothetical protein